MAQEALAAGSKRAQKKAAESAEAAVFSRNFASIRQAKGMTKKQMAELLAVSPTTVAAYEAGEKSPSLSTAAMIARKCNVSLDWLCGISKASPKREEMTYKEPVECLIRLSRLTELEIGIEELPNPYGESWMGYIKLRDEALTAFVREWQNVKRLYDEKTIDSSLYDPWIAQKLAEYDVTKDEWEFVHDDASLDALF